MACGPNRVPGRCEVPPSNGAPRNTTSYPPPSGPGAASDSSEVRSTPANVMSGPYIPRVISGSAISPRLRLHTTNDQKSTDQDSPERSLNSAPQVNPRFPRWPVNPPHGGGVLSNEARWQAGHRASVIFRGDGLPAWGARPPIPLAPVS